jgi:hypothetical protein
MLMKKIPYFKIYLIIALLYIGWNLETIAITLKHSAQCEASVKN